MTQEDKDILLRDLCTRLPYGVKIALKNNEAYHHDNVAKIGDVTIDRLKGFNGKYFSIYHDNPLDWDWYVSEISVEDCKPYLFPLSSMTEEQRKEFELISDLSYASAYGEEIVYSTKIIDFFNKNHFDYRGLIEKGLAIDATNLNIY